MTAKRGLFVFLVFGILIFSSISFVSAQEPIGKFSFLDFVDAAISKEKITGTYSWGSTYEENLLEDLYNRCAGEEIYIDKGACNKYRKVSAITHWESGDFTKEGVQCLNICKYRRTMAESLPDLIFCEHVVGKAKENRLIDITTSTRDLYDIEYDLSSDFERNRKDDNSVPPGYAYNLVSSSYETYFSEFPKIGEEDSQGRDAYRMVLYQRIDKCNNDLAKLSEEEPTPSSAEKEPIDNGKTESDSKTVYTAYITDYKGEVMIKDHNGNSKPITGKISIGEGITLITGKTGKVLIAFKSDGSKIELGPNAQFTVGDSKTESILDFGKLKAKFNCLTSTIKSKFGATKPRNCYPLRFPQGFASVRGTEYIAVANQSSNTTTIFVNEGTVSVTETKTGSTQNVSGGNSGVVDDSGIKVRLMPQSEWKNAAGEFNLEKNEEGGSLQRWALYFGILVVLLAIGWLVYKKMRNKNDSKIVKKQNVVNKKSEKISGETKKFGVASLILAILGILFLLLPFVGIVLAAIAVVLSRIQKKYTKTWLTIAGLIIGVIGIILNGLIILSVTVK